MNLRKASWTDAKLLEAVSHLPASFDGGQPFRVAAIRVTGKQAHGENLRRLLLAKGWVTGRPVHGNRWTYTVARPSRRDIALSDEMIRLRDYGGGAD